MTKILKDLTWLLKDTIEYYNKYPNKRSIQNGGCVYSGKNSKNKTSPGCAIGRHMKPADRLMVDDMFGVIGVDELCNQYSEFLPEWMMKIESHQLAGVQFLHDTDKFWTPEGISDEGLAFVEYRFRDVVNLNEVLSYEQLSSLKEDNE